MGQLIPDDLMPAGKMLRIVTHWTAGAGFPSAEDASSYHVLIDCVGKVHRGDHPITDNLSTADDDYAAHTRGLNTGSIGLALCGMAGASQHPFAPGRYPIKKPAWNNMLIAAADLCRRYKITPDERGLLMHAEVERIYNVAQRGKWDVTVLSFDRGAYQDMTPAQEMRERVGVLLGGK